MSTAAWQKKNGQVKKPKMKSTLVKEKPQRHTSEVSRIFSGPGEIFNVKSPSIKNTKYENLNNFKIKAQTK